MGACCGGQQSTDPNVELANAPPRVDRYFNILLIGAGSSGKTTFLNHSRLLHDNKFDEREQRDFITKIHANILDGIKSLATAMDDFQYLDRTPDLEDLTALSIWDDPSIKQHLADIPNISETGGVFDEEAIGMISQLWAHKEIQQFYSETRHLFTYPDNIKYFLDHVERVTRLDYMPSEEDMLRTFVRSTGRIEHLFPINNDGFRFVDLGGQRNERKKWVHNFENLNCVVFFVSLIGYDERLYEDETRLKMQESMTLFEEIANSRWFKETHFVVVLNKSDLFRDYLQVRPERDLNVCFDDFDPRKSMGMSDPNEKVEWIRHQFLKRYDGDKRYLHFEIMCGLDADSVKKGFDSIVKIARESSTTSPTGIL